MGKKGKLTWMEYNSEEVDDSEFCIEYLNRKLEIDLDNHLTSRDRGTARAFQKMLEENTYWYLCLLLFLIFLLHFFWVLCVN